jgi:hypothetical protein
VSKQATVHSTNEVTTVRDTNTQVVRRIADILRIWARPARLLALSEVADRLGVHKEVTRCGSIRICVRIAESATTTAR